MHGALVEGKKKKAGIIFPMCPSQQLVPLIEEINNAEMGFCRELPFSALDFQISYLSLNFRKWENPQISDAQVFQNPFRAKTRGRKWRKRVSGHPCSSGRNSSATLEIKIVILWESPETWS